MDTSKQPGLQIAQVLLLSAQFAHRDDALSVAPNTVIENLTVNLEAKVAGQPGDPVAVVRLRAFTDKESKFLYGFDVEIAAVITRVPDEENLDPFEYARNMGPAAFFPFLREAVASITMKGRFGAVWLKPVNFLAIPQQTAAEVATLSEG